MVSEEQRYIVIQNGSFADGKGTKAYQVYKYDPKEGVYVGATDIGQNYPAHYEKAMELAKRANAGEKS